MTVFVSDRIKPVHESHAQVGQDRIGQNMPVSALGIYQMVTLIFKFVILGICGSHA